MDPTDVPKKAWIECNPYISSRYCNVPNIPNPKTEPPERTIHNPSKGFSDICVFILLSSGC